MARVTSIEQALGILGLDPSAGPDDLKQSFRDLNEVWHPDRFNHNTRLQELATDRLKEINEAFQFLMARSAIIRAADTAQQVDPVPRLLCVDDDILVLKGFQRLLSLRYAVVTAASATEGLDILLKEGEFAVILSDLKMPETDGIAFLRRAKQASPQSTRILLTGYRDAIPMTVTLEQDFIFRILDKGCGEDLLWDALQQGVDLWRAKYKHASSLA